MWIQEKMLTQCQAGPNDVQTGEAKYSARLFIHFTEHGCFETKIVLFGHC
jgi:hypothetical protein